jgi:hypothetical protein
VNVQWPSGLIASWDCGFESRWVDGYLSPLKCRVLSGRGLHVGPIPGPEESYRMWCVTVHDLGTLMIPRPWTALGRCAEEEEEEDVEGLVNVSTRNKAWAGIAHKLQWFETGWTVRGPEADLGGVFRTRPDRSWDPPNFLCNGYQVPFPESKRPDRGINYPPSSSAEDKERVQLYLYSPSGSSRPLQGRNLPFHT